ncbi:flagellar biosynthetic protein FliO [Colwellia sp. C1TZA3]|uniref:flagellar biosynthetic protein FliO n=1 Tax=Colwellia sp. C1TZA3 TaxID=2508879 RepID=UPI0011B9E93A|nr:flagellar biosynthetic protein FliO [Colwellia sp. C1TZA3]TWX64955.1 flagellar biosynthetic protein FliO [Colwellia sp. C1TZA3]
MKKTLSVFFSCLAFATFGHAQAVVSDVSDVTLVDAPVEVGKHVAANMDAMSMILSLLMVLAVIIISAMILKRFQGVSQTHQGLKIVTSLHLGSKEKLVVVQAGDKQLLLGVTTQQITLLETLDKPLVNAKENNVDFAQSLVKLFKQKAIKSYDKQK